MRFLIRVDASNKIGSGHVMRCLALGQQLIDEKHEVYFLTKTNNELILNKLKKEKFSVIKVEGKTNLTNDAAQTVETAKQNEIDWIILDGYQFTTGFQKKIKNNNFKLLCIDDIADTHFVSDIVLNQNLNADKIFQYSCEPYTKLLLGTKYVLLRREFLKEKNWERKFNDECKNILITMGGSDPQNNTAKILSAMNNIKKKLNVKVILGANNKFIETIKKSIKSSKHKIEIKKNVEDMVPLIKWADLAITAAGSTVWELAFLQTPMVIGIIADNQKYIAAEMGKEGFAKSLGWINKMNEKSISFEISKTISSSTFRRKKINLLKDKLNKPDTTKLLEAINFKKEFYFRRANKKDIKRVYDLSNDPFVRKNSISTEKILWDDHVTWFNHKIKDKNYIIFLAFDINDNFIGQIKFKLINNEADISISIIENFRGKSYSKYLIKEASKKIFNEFSSINKINALIKPENISSIKGFKNAGFKFLKEEFKGNQLYKKFVLKK